MNLVIKPVPPATVPVTDPPGGSFPVRRIYCVGRKYVEHAIVIGPHPAARRRSSS